MSNTIDPQLISAELAAADALQQRARRNALRTALRLMAQGVGVVRAAQMTGLSRYQCARLRRDNLPPAPWLAQSATRTPEENIPSTRWRCVLPDLDVALAVRGTRYEELMPEGVRSICLRLQGAAASPSEIWEVP